MSKAVHWADIYAEKVIRDKGEKECYVCASGITPSGTVHIGNFREIISVELVIRALKDMGKNTRYVFSWDDFDVFRKVPKNISNASDYEAYLRVPIVDIPDPWNRANNYAKGNELAIESLLGRVGIFPEYIYQAKEYRNGTYTEGIRLALQYRNDILEILNAHRDTPLGDDWYPISIFSAFTNRDNTKILHWDGEWNVRYVCLDTNKEDTIDIRDSSLVKLLWRIDWPMRWKQEQVDFEPAGKDHHSKGGSFDTAREIVDVVYHYEAPVTFQYDFVRIKGGTGKISSSSGDVIGLEDVLKVYTPQLVRFLFAGTRPNSEFAISFDVDVIKIYEDYDRLEREYYASTADDANANPKLAKRRRMYELSQTHHVSKVQPFQIPFRHLCNLLQIYHGDQKAVISRLQENGELSDVQIQEHGEYLTLRMTCAWNWIRHYAPEDFKFRLKDPLIKIFIEKLQSFIKDLSEQSKSEDVFEKLKVSIKELRQESKKYPAIKISEFLEKISDFLEKISDDDEKMIKFFIEKLQSFIKALHEQSKSEDVFEKLKVSIKELRQESKKYPTAEISNFLKKFNDEDVEDFLKEYGKNLDIRVWHEDIIKISLDKDLGDKIIAARTYLRKNLAERWDSLDDKGINELIYEAIHKHQLDNIGFFKDIYKRLIGKEKGPRLGNFMRIIGKDRILEYLA